MENIEFNEKIEIIKHADLEDAVILIQNYLQLINDTPDVDDQKKKYIQLYTTAEQRVQELAR